MLSDAPSTALALIFVGGFLGGFSRWALARVLPPRESTWAANIVGATVAGFALTMPSPWQFLVSVGFAGACSTFSTLSKEIGELLKARSWGQAAKYTLASAVMGIAAAGFGMIWGYAG